MIISKKHFIKWHNKNQEHFESKGYIFTKRGDLFEVQSEHLAPHSKVFVDVQCDYCGDLHKKQFGNYNVERRIIPKDACKDCKYLKQKETNIEKYGCHPNQLEEVKQKVIETNLLKYGVEHYSQTKESKENLKKVMLERYGVENYSQTQEYKEKYAKTSLERYGVDHYSKTDEYLKRTQETNTERYGVPSYSQTKEYSMAMSEQWENRTEEEIQEITKKRQQTSLQKYGVSIPIQHPEIKKKAMQTSYQKGNMTASSQQIYICDLVNGTLNFPVGLSHLDIAFLEEKIFIEYDGGGHNLGVKLGNITQEYLNAKDRKRTFNLFDKGWKEIRLVSGDDKLPKDFEILMTVEKAKSFLMERRNKSVIINWDRRTVLISFKMEISLDNFLRDDYEFIWEVS